ncbi:MAG: GlsB/YeaQ/YmgE family stress response rane protein [Microbacteriaceae bacterium]|nr:GlsB/YeaQ/YmgE family stress response rane protein [Microbacteriaceae bacterium]
MRAEHPVRKNSIDWEVDMGIIGWIVLGLIAGAIAKAVLPGRQGGGWLMTLLLGVVGALVGGFIGSAIFGIGLEEFWSIQTWLVAILGAILVLAIYGFVTRGSRSRA